MVKGRSLKSIFIWIPFLRALDFNIITTSFTISRKSKREIILLFRLA